MNNKELNEFTQNEIKKCIDLENLVRTQQIDYGIFSLNKRILDYHQSVRKKLKVLEIIETKKVDVSVLVCGLDEYNEHIRDNYFSPDEIESRLVTEEEYYLIIEDINNG